MHRRHTTKMNYWVRLFFWLRNQKKKNLQTKKKEKWLKAKHLKTKISLAQKDSTKKKKNKKPISAY